MDDSLEAAHTADVVNALSGAMQAALEEHPVNVQRRAEGKGAANVVLLRGCGSRCASLKSCPDLACCNCMAVDWCQRIALTLCLVLQPPYPLSTVLPSCTCSCLTHRRALTQT